MCGRYQLGMDWEQLQAHYRLVQEIFDGKYTLPWYNQAPGQPSPAIVAGEAGLEHRTMRWGFPPLWVAKRGKDPWKERPLVNAKSEQARSKATWRKPFAQRRCLVPSTGFYEWVRRDKAKFPLHFCPADGGILTFGGIWTAFKRDDGLRMCMSILTTGPGPEMAPVHDRSPVILARQDWDRWLSNDTPPEEIDALCAPAPAGTLDAVEVNTAVNGWKASGPEVLEADWAWTERPSG